MNITVTGSNVSELFRENQQGEKIIPPLRLEKICFSVKLNASIGGDLLFKNLLFNILGCENPNQELKCSRQNRCMAVARRGVRGFQPHTNLL